MTSQLQWRTDKDGMLLGPRAHDGTIHGLDYGEDESLVLRVRRTGGDFVAIKVSGVKHVGVVQFRSGAIVSEIFAWKLRDFSNEIRDVPDGPWNVLFAGDLKFHDVQKAAERLIETWPDCYLLHVLCSYGGTLAALGSSIVIEDVSDFLMPPDFASLLMEAYKGYVSHSGSRSSFIQRLLPSGAEITNLTEEEVRNEPRTYAALFSDAHRGDIECACPGAKRTPPSRVREVSGRDLRSRLSAVRRRNGIVEVPLQGRWSARGICARL
jgi:hypothetical protein